MSHLGTILAFAFVALAAPSFAQPPSECRNDVLALCADAKTQGRDAVRACMKAHKEQLSDACKESLGARRGGSSQNRDDHGSDSGLQDAATPPQADQSGGPPAACREDVKKLCAGARSQGRDAMKSCMMQHMQDLTQACKDQIDATRQAKLDDSAKQGPAGDAEGFKAAVKGIMQSCGNEKGLFCNGVQPQDGALMRCLMKHRADATPDCQGALDAAKPYAARRRAAR